MEDLTGVKCHLLTVTKWKFRKNDKWHWICDCECGRSAIYAYSDLVRRVIKSCGCWRKKIAVDMGKRNVKHAKVKTPEWLAWRNMRVRCYSEKCKQYHRYGGRGITVCDRWTGEDGFSNFLADMGTRPSNKHSLDRIDSDGNYEPSNCRWATSLTQQRNRTNNRKITAFGKTLGCSEWAELTGLTLALIHRRVFSGGVWPEIALTASTARQHSKLVSNPELVLTS